MSETAKPEVTSQDIRKALDESAAEILREQREEIIRRAHKKIKASAKKD